MLCSVRLHILLLTHLMHRGIWTCLWTLSLFSACCDVLVLVWAVDKNDWCNRREICQHSACWIRSKLTYGGRSQEGASNETPLHISPHTHTHSCSSTLGSPVPWNSTVEEGAEQQRSKWKRREWPETWMWMPRMVPRFLRRLSRFSSTQSCIFLHTEF